MPHIVLFILISFLLVADVTHHRAVNPLRVSRTGGDGYSPTPFISTNVGLTSTEMISQLVSVSRSCTRVPRREWRLIPMRGWAGRLLLAPATHHKNNACQYEDGKRDSQARLEH